MKKPIIFLDVDGVLNTDSMIASSADHKGIPNDNTPFGEWCKDRATLIREFANEVGAEIVLSSSWRLFWTLDEIRGFLNLELVDKTPNLNTIRGEEISTWLNRNRDFETPFVIFDDESDMEPFLDHLVKTEFFGEGLTIEHINKARTILQGQGVQL